METKNLGGRPTIYTKELGDYICGQITLGKSLVAICAEESMPCPTSIYMWLRTDKEFLKNYELAKDSQADYFVEETLTIPDSEPDVARAKLKVDVRKWAASKYKPKKYGDKTALDIGGQHGDNPLQQEHTIKATPEQLEHLKQYVIMKHGTDNQTV